jgi:hypothetical protein
MEAPSKETTLKLKSDTLEKLKKKRLRSRPKAWMLCSSGCCVKNCHKRYRFARRGQRKSMLLVRKREEKSADSKNIDRF